MKYWKKKKILVNKKQTEVVKEVIVVKPDPIVISAVKKVNKAKATSTKKKVKLSKKKK